jgi:hypothetical protein
MVARQVIMITKPNWWKFLRPTPTTLPELEDTVTILAKIANNLNLILSTIQLVLFSAELI